MDKFDSIQGGMLSDLDIRKYFGSEIKIYTDVKNGDLYFDLDKQLQLASIDLRFRNEFKRFKKGLTQNLTYEMLKNHEYTDPFEIANNQRLVVNPGEIILTTTLETVFISNNFAGIITGRSSIARLGIMVHCCQEFVNPGQGAPIALQITNLGEYPVELDMHVPICQLILFRLASPASNLYSQIGSSKYKDENEPLSSRIYEESTFANSDKQVTTPVIPTAKPSGAAQHRLKSILKTYIEPLLPSLIMLLIITPFLNSTQQITFSSIIEYFSQVPINAVLALVFLVLFIYSRRAEH